MRLEVAKADTLFAASIFTPNLEFFVYAHKSFAWIDEFGAFALKGTDSEFNRSSPINFKPVQQTTTAKQLATVLTQLWFSHHELADSAVEVLCLQVDKSGWVETDLLMVGWFYEQSGPINSFHRCFPSKK